MQMLIHVVIGRINGLQYTINYFHTCADIGTTQPPRLVAAIRIPTACTSVLANYAPALGIRRMILWPVDIKILRQLFRLLPVHKS